mgnify:CR=1 FL=1
MNERIDLPAPRLLVTVDWVCARLGLSRPRVYALTASGALPCVRLGRAIRYDPDRIERFISDGGTAAAA